MRFENVDVLVVLMRDVVRVLISWRLNVPGWLPCVLRLISVSDVRVVLQGHLRVSPLMLALHPPS